ncbi:MAG: L-2-hydroxyglutarate oxidase [Oligoflexia bacterium]|nr:L-2-hydroxyglutarate oxidase [Oligoflexia bacterium]
MGAESFDYIIVGAGIMGLAIARQLHAQRPNDSILILEKEEQLAFHASGRNSGVLHAGFYYSADSLKAKFCVQGNARLKSFCKTNKIPLNECGKLVVAGNASELTQLRELGRRGEINKAGTQLISADEAQKIQPGVYTHDQALFSPNTATSDPRLVAAALRTEIEALGVKISTHTRFISRKQQLIHTTRGDFNYRKKLINAAGLYADKIAHQYGLGLRYTVLPFKGLYLKYAKNKSDVRTNIYPVPDPRFPFLGVHFTITVDGTIKIGPTAIPAFWRENYSGLSRFSLHEFAAISRLEANLFISNAFNFRTLALEEMRKFQRSYMIGLASRLVPSIDKEGFGEYSTPGIRAQLFDRVSNSLVQDFVIEADQTSVHVLNAVSPGWTCSFPFADYIIESFVLKDMQ